MLRVPLHVLQLQDSQPLILSPLSSLFLRVPLWRPPVPARVPRQRPESPALPLHSGARHAFIFNASIDRLIRSAKLAVIDGLPFDVELDPSEPVLIPPKLLRNLGNTCWLNVLMHSLAVNPLLQKWFLSGGRHVDRLPRGRCSLSHLLRR